MSLCSICKHRCINYDYMSVSPVQNHLKRVGSVLIGSVFKFSFSVTSNAMTKTQYLDESEHLYTHKKRVNNISFYSKSDK